MHKIRLTDGEHLGQAHELLFLYYTHTNCYNIEGNIHKSLFLSHLYASLPFPHLWFIDGTKKKCRRQMARSEAVSWRQNCRVVKRQVFYIKQLN